MLKTVFSIKLSQQILPGRVAIGKFNGTSPCLVAATSAQKVIMHSPVPLGSRATSSPAMGDPEDEDGPSSGLNPFGSSSTNGDISFLNINQTINSIATGPLKPESPNDLLVIGTPTSLFVYDVLNNSDVFYRDIPDGANSVVVGSVGSSDKVLAIAGGNCALQGFDGDGNDSYWTVTGDNITSLSLFDIDDDGTNELLVGSEDYDIRVFKEDAILYELSETDAVTCLCPISPGTFGYALANGTVGVYHKQDRLWRIKSKNQAVTIVSWDLDGDGIPELITGWTSGKVDGRNIENGEVIFKDNFSDPIASICLSDYNRDGQVELMVVSVSGEVRGYQRTYGHQNIIEMDFVDSHEEEIVIRDLIKKKQAIELELKNYEENYRVANLPAGSAMGGKAATEDDTFGSIPLNTQIRSTLILCPDEDPSAIQLSLSSSNETVIRTAVIFAEGIFQDEGVVIHPSDQDVDSTIKLLLKPEKDNTVDLHVEVVVGYKGSYHYHVFELTRRLPKFAMYALVPTDPNRDSLPIGQVTFTLNERTSRIAQWVHKNFLVENETLDATKCLQVHFLCLRDTSFLTIQFDQETAEMVIGTDNIELAGEMVQSLVVDHLSLEEMTSRAQFPKEMDNLKSMVSKVEEIQSVRQQLAADIADNSATIRALVIRAEDARLMNEYKMMKQVYGDLNLMNNELLNEYKIRSQNHQDLVNNLKQINLVIQKAANLRVGKTKAALIQACRLAIKQSNLSSLSKIITTGQV